MKQIATLSIFLLFVITSFAQAPAEFFKSYRMSSTLRERSENLLLLKSGNLIDIGETSNCTGVSTCYNSCALIWFDRQGNEIRNRKIGHSIGFFGVDAAETNDKSLIVHGNFTDDVVFMKTDSLGHPLWSKAIDAETDLSGLNIVKIDSLYFVNGPLGYDSSMVYSFTESGNFRWMKKPESVHRFQLRSIAECNGKIYGIAKLTDEANNYYSGACVFEMDVNGNVLNSQIITPSFTGYLRDPAFRICKTSDGNLVATYSIPSGTQYVLKMTPSLNVLWTKAMTANPTFNSGYHDCLVADNEGGVWIGSHFLYSTTICFVHVDANGELLETNNYSNNDLIEMSGMAYSPDCNLFISGARRDGVIYSHFLASLGKDGKTDCLDSMYNATVSAATLSFQAYPVSMTQRSVTVSDVTMINEEGVYQEIVHCSGAADICAVNFVAIPGDRNDVKVYPNPVTDVLNVEGNDIRRIDMYDVNGKLIMQTVNATVLNIGDLDRGIYVIKVYTANNLVIKRVVKL